MESNPNKVKDKDYYLNLIKREIVLLTNNGQNEDIVIIHNGYEMSSSSDIAPVAQYFNPVYYSDTQNFTIDRLIPAPIGGEYADRLVYSFHEDSAVIYARYYRSQGNLDRLDGIKSENEKQITLGSVDEIEHVFRFLDGLQLTQKEAEKVLRKHRKSLKFEYGIDNGNIPPGKFRRLLDRIFHDIDE